MRLIQSTALILVLVAAACSGGGGSTPPPPDVPIGDGTPAQPTATDQTGSNARPFVIVATGDANMLGSNEDGSGDFVTNSDVRVFENGNFITSQTDVAPYGTTQAATQNLAHWFGQRVYEETGTPVRILFYAREDSLIEWWLDGQTPEGDNIRREHERIVNQGFLDEDLADHDISKVDVFIWHQGERNWDLELYPSEQFYRPTLEAVFDAYRENSWMDENTPILVGELAERGQERNSGRSGTTANQNAVLSGYGGKNNIWTVEMADLPTDTSRQNFTGQGLQTAGYERYWDAWVTANNTDSNEGDSGDARGDGGQGDSDGDSGDSGTAGDDGGSGEDNGDTTGGGGHGDGDNVGHHSHPNIVNIPAPFSTISRSFDRKAIIVSDATRGTLKAKNLNSAFRVQCGVARTERLDPVLSRGPNDAMSHMHTFFGGDVELNVNTKNSDLRANGVGSTCSGGRVNRSLYWMPTMLRSAGDDTYEPIMPINYHAYYKTQLGFYGRHKDVILQKDSGIPHATLIRRAMPAELPREWFDLRMIAHSLGDNDSVNRRNDPIWECTDKSGKEISSRDGIPDCGQGKLALEFWFPQCLNVKKMPRGTDADDPGNYSRTGQDRWLRYAVHDTERNGCPKNDTQNEWVRIPTLSFSVDFEVDHRGTKDWVLSSDLMAGDVRPGSTIHGDFVNGWNEEVADDWYRFCIMDGGTCTNFFKPVGTNRWRKLEGNQERLFTNSN